MPTSKYFTTSFQVMFVTGPVPFGKTCIGASPLAGTIGEKKYVSLFTTGDS
jgi:hypothetical protein